MKKYLFGASALIGVAMTSIGSASAAELSISGAVKATLGIGAGESAEAKNVNGNVYYNSTSLNGNPGSQSLRDANPALANNPLFGFRLDDAGLVFKAKEETAAGLQIEGVIDLEAGGGAAVLDEAYVTLGSPFVGRLEIGFNDSVDFGPQAHSILSGNGGWDGGHMNFISPKLRSYINGVIEFDGNGGDAGQLAYYTPSFGGFRAAVSYKPSSAFGGNASVNTTAANSSGLCNFRTELLGGSSLYNQVGGDGSCVSNNINPGLVLSTDVNVVPVGTLKLVNTNGLSHMTAAGIEYANTFGDWNLNTGVTGTFAMSGQFGGGRGLGYGVRLGATVTYQSTYTGNIGFIYQAFNPYADTNRGANSKIALSVGGAYNYGAGAVSLGVAWQSTTLYREYTQAEYDATGNNALTNAQKRNPYKALAPNNGIGIALGGSYIVAPGVSMLLDLTFVLGLPGGDVKAFYNTAGYSAIPATGLAAPALTADTDISGNYPSTFGVAIGLSSKVAF